MFRDKNKLYACNINWDVDMNDIYSVLDEMTAERAAEALEVPYDRYANMTTEERHQEAFDRFRDHPSLISEFMGLPEEVEIPSELAGDDDAITEWLSDTYEFCIREYALSSDNAGTRITDDVSHEEVEH